MDETQMYRERTLESSLRKATAGFPILLVTGSRQVGKTTLLQHLSRDNRTFVTLDDPMQAALAREEPALFLQRFKPPVLIDEIQYAPELLPHIKMAVDKERKTGMFWLTGSQQFQSMQGVSESLAGRVGILRLLGFSLKEIWNQARSAGPFLPTNKQLQERLIMAHSLSLQDVYHIIWRGSYPTMWRFDNRAGFGGGDAYDAGKEDGSGYGNGRKVLIFPPVDRDLFYGSYVQTYLQRDVRDLAHVGDEGAFLKFIRATAARTGQLLVISELARDAAVSVPTATRWLSILETSGVIFLLEPYPSNATKRLIKAPKLYFLDTGLCAYLTEWSSPETLEAGAMSGAILETFIFTEILKSYWHNGKRAPLYYYRDKDKKEIDLLIVQNEVFYPLEFKKTASPGKNTVKHFELLKRLKRPVKAGGVICLSETLLPIDQNTHAIPVGFL